MKQIILSLILALATQFSFAVAPDSLKRDLEDYDYLVSFVEENYAPFTVPKYMALGTPSAAS